MLLLYIPVLVVVNTAYFAQYSSRAKGATTDVVFGICLQTAVPLCVCSSCRSLPRATQRAVRHNSLNHLPYNAAADGFSMHMLHTSCSPSQVDLRAQYHARADSLGSEPLVQRVMLSMSPQRRPRWALSTVLHLTQRWLGCLPLVAPNRRRQNAVHEDRHLMHAWRCSPRAECHRRHEPNRLATSVRRP